MTTLALCDALPNMTIAASHSGLESSAEGNYPGHSREESLRAVLLSEFTSRERRHIHMIPARILFGVATGGGDFGSDHSLSVYGAILPLWSQISVRTRGVGWGEQDIIFTDLVTEFKAGERLASLTEFSDHQIELQGWTIVTIYATDDETKRIITQGPRTAHGDSLWLVELVLLAGNRREANIKGRPEDKVYRILHIICDDDGLLYDHSADQTGWATHPVTTRGGVLPRP
jgi:hypothetical protein